MMAGSVACTECRRSHLKCNLQRPVCARCATNRLSCTYLPSRRGGRRVPREQVVCPPSADRPRAAAVATPTPASPAWPTPAAVRSEGRDGGGGDANHGRSPAPSLSNPGSGSGSGSYSSGSLASHRPPPNEGSSAQQQHQYQQPYVPEARLVHLYYTFFHQAHPILVPAASYNRQDQPDYLHQVVRFIGSHYSKVLRGDDFLEQTTVLLSRDERSPAMVQALLLFSIIMSARNSRREAVAALSRAVSLALDLGMSRADFAVRYSDGSDLQTESLRRTWWELYIWEIYLALPDGKFTLRCSDVDGGAYLPCEEAAYAPSSSSSSASQRGPPSPPRTFSAFRARLFSSPEGDSDDNGSTEQQPPSSSSSSQSPSHFSSYSYRIEAFHILARVMVLNTLHETHPDHLQSVVNMIVSWGHLLPPCKVDVVDMYGNIDEMLFQAQFIIHYAAALLHVPRSNLRPKFPDLPSTICPETPVRLSPSLTRHIHDVKATEASKELSNLLSVHSRPEGYSPSMIPGAVLSGLVQLAAAEAHASECFEHHQNRAILVLATLSILKMQWATAREAYSHVKAAAAAHMTVAAACATASQPVAAAAAAAASQQPSQVQQAFGGADTRMYDESNTNAEYNANAMDTTMSSSTMDPIDRIFMAGLLSPHIDPTCGEPLALNQFANFD
ncbi:hypothetical protein ACQRIU_000383 [Beauveria bassiana]